MLGPGRRAQAGAVRRQAAGRPADGRDHLRQADPAHPGVVRGRHRRARRPPDAGRRRARRDRRARVGRRTSPGCSAGRRRPIVWRTFAQRDLERDGRVRRRPGRQRAHRRLPPLPAARRPADRARAPGRAGRADRRLRRRRRLQHGQLLAARRRHRRDARPGQRARRLRARRRRWSPGRRPIAAATGGSAALVRDPRRGGRRRRRRGHRHLGVDGQGGRGGGSGWPPSRPYSVTAELLAAGRARRDRAALPARLPRQGDRRRGASTARSSVVWDEAENRRHAQKAISPGCWRTADDRRRAPASRTPRARASSAIVDLVDAPRGALADRARRPAGRAAAARHPGHAVARPGRARRGQGALGLRRAGVRRAGRGRRPHAGAPARDRRPARAPAGPALRGAAGQRRGERQPGRAAHPARAPPSSSPRAFDKAELPRRPGHHRRRRHRPGDRPRPAAVGADAGRALPGPGRLEREDDEREHHQHRRALGRPVRRGPERRARGALPLHPLRLAAGALRPGRVPRARPGPAPRPGCSTDDEHAELDRGLDALARAVRRRRPGARPGRRGRARRPRAAAARRGRRRDRRPAARRAVPQRPDRHPVQGLSCATTRRIVADARARPGRRARAAQARAAPRGGHAGPDAPAARPAGAAVAPPAGPRLAAAARRRRGSRDWDARVAVDSPYGSGALAGSSLGLDPRGGRRATWASPGPARTPSTAPPRATSSPSSPS